MNHAFYWLANHFSKYALLPPLASVRVIGRENIPMTGPLILASNHLNDTDPPIIGFYFPRTVVTLAKDEMFHYPGLKQFLQLYGAIPVRRGQADLSSLRKAQEALQQGYTVCVFPEGTRSGERASLGQAWPGAGFLALRTGAPVLPLAITGSQKLALPKMFLHPFPRQHVTLTFGEPFLLEKPQRVDADAARAATQTIMERIAALLPPEYRGYYGNDGDATADASSGTGE